MFNPDFNTSVVLDAVLPVIFGDNIPTPIETANNLSWYYHEEEDNLHRWEVTVYHEKEGGEVFSIHAPSFKEWRFTNQMKAIWTNYIDSTPYLSTRENGRDWYSNVSWKGTVKEQAFQMANEIKEAFDLF